MEQEDFVTNDELCEKLAECLQSYHYAYKIMNEDGENYWMRFKNNYHPTEMVLKEYKDMKKAKLSGSCEGMQDGTCKHNWMKTGETRDSYGFRCAKCQSTKIEFSKCDGMTKEQILAVINDWENTPDCPDNEWDLAERIYHAQMTGGKK